jgi:hypothetical protein
MSKSPINFGMMSGVGGMMSTMLSNQYGNMSDQDLRRQYDAYSRMGGGIMGGVGSFFGAQRNAMQAEIQRRQMLGNFGMPQQGSGGGPGASFTDPNNTTTTGNFSINPNAAGGFANAVEATGAPGEPTQFADGSEGYMVNRFGGFAGPTGGGTIPANVATANNFSTDTSKAAAQIFGNSTQFQPRKRLITL